MIMVEMRVIR